MITGCGGGGPPQPKPVIPIAQNPAQADSDSDQTQTQTQAIVRILMLVFFDLPTCLKTSGDPRQSTAVNFPDLAGDFEDEGYWSLLV